jgi:hypothetical protein
LTQLKIALRLTLPVVALLAASCMADISEVETRQASPLGPDAMSINGRIQPHELPTVYWFEYGTDTGYSHRTDARPLPPKLAAHYHES